MPMKSKFAMSVVLALTCSLNAFAATKEKYSDRGNSVLASFNTISTVTCGDGSQGEKTTSYSFVAAENVVRENGQAVAAKLLDLSINIFETCGFTSQSLRGSTAFGVYSQNGTGTAASATGSIDLIDLVTGAPAGTVSVNLQFTSISGVTKTKNFQRLVSPETKITIRSTGEFRDSSIAGSLVVDGVNVIPFVQDVDSEIGKNTFSTRTIIRNAQN